MVGCINKKVITGIDIRQHFHQTVCAAIDNQNIEASEHTIIYLVNLLTKFADSKKLYDKSSHSLTLKPLAHHYIDALSHSSESNRHRTLKRLGDIALFIAGIFSDSFNKRIIDIDYYIGMGGNAYAYLSATLKNNEHYQVHGCIYDELASGFTEYVDVFTEVSEQSHLSSHKDLLRLYEIWMKTDSKRAEKKLKEYGIYPVKSMEHSRKH